jgi:pimeloyl-ACP methyl ester carboxylesterase
MAATPHSRSRSYRRRVESASTWPGRLLSTSVGPVFVRDALRVDHVQGVAPPEEWRADRSSGGQAVPRPGEDQRQPVLFVHGLGGESLDWVDVADQLADQFDCYALDLPGFADSPPPPDGVSLDGLVRSVAGVAEEIGPVYLVGNSLGGAVATRVTAEHPDLVRSLTLVSPALPDLRPRPSSAQLTVALLPLVGPAIVRVVLRADPERMAKRIYRLCYGDPKNVSATRHAAELASLRRRATLQHSPVVYRSALRAVVRSYLQRGPRGLWTQAAAVGVPTLLIYGGRDRLVHPRMAARAERTFRDAEVLCIPEIGHVAHLEDPKRVADALRAFLTRPDLIRGMGERHGTVVPID